MTSEIKKKPTYGKEKVKIRFCRNEGKCITTKQFLKGLLPALWDEKDREQAIATTETYVTLFNETPGFFYPFPIDFLKTRLLDIHVGHFGHFPWDASGEDIFPLCRTCGNWDYKEGTMIRFLAGDWEAFLCPDCTNVLITDPCAEKAGVTHNLTRKQFKERFGVDAPNPPSPLIP